MQYATGHTPRLTGGTISAGQGQRAQMPQAPEYPPLHVQELPSPGHAIGAQPDPIGSQTEHRLINPVLGANRRNVGMMVLHRNGGNLKALGQSKCSPGRVIIRVGIVRQRLRSHRKDGLKVFGRLIKGCTCRRVVKPADVLRKERLPATGDAHASLEVGAEGQHRGPHVGQWQRERRKTPGAAQKLDATSRTHSSPRRQIRPDSQHGVIAAHNNVPIMHEQYIGNLTQTFKGLVVPLHKGLSMGVGTRHHQGEGLGCAQPGNASGTAGGLMKQQILQGSVGQHHADLIQPRSHSSQNGVEISLLAKQHDRSFGTFETGRLGSR